MSWFLDEEIEVVRPDLPRGRFRCVLFDFDGTLSLIRAGWHQVMIAMMVEALQATGTRETPAALAQHVEELVMRLNGRPTIFQMIQLAEEVRQRGGTPRDPVDYKHDYQARLMARIRGRLDELESRPAAATDWTVPGSHALLEALRRRGLPLYLASGTDVNFVRREAQLLGLSAYFGNRIYGASDGEPNFSKKLVIEQMFRDHVLSGEELLGFGDGDVEIEQIRAVGGVAVAVASDEERRQGINAWKRHRLIRAGADVVIPDYRQHQRLLSWLMDEV